ncbi:hypothetical protein [Lentzea sp. E54]|uniref:hypothetical protein n=1 Tax=Lentzea xerophila TaxID=3435883 RepID=UPI003DA20322
MSFTKKVLIAAGAVILLSACDSKPSSGPTSNPVTRPPSSTAPLADTAQDRAKRDALAAYQGLWDEFVTAATKSDWQSPQLGQYATGLALSTLTRGLRLDHDNGLVSKGSPTHDTEVSSVDPATDPVKVIISDCSDSTNALKYRADNGQRADDKAGGRRFIKATVEKQADGSWKVSDFGVQAVGSC